MEKVAPKPKAGVHVERLYKLHVGIDIGHGNTKIAVRKYPKTKNNKKEDWFYNKFGSYVTVVSSETEYMNFITNDYLYDVISFDGITKYLFGNVVMRENKVDICQRGKNFFMSEPYKVLLAAGIDSVIKNVIGPDVTKIMIDSLGLGLPLTYVRMQDVVNAIKGYFTQDGDSYIFEYQRNNIEYTVIIKNLALFSQGAGALLTSELRKSIRDYKACGIIDIGQYTTDYFLFRDGEIILDSVGTEEHGAYEVLNEIRNQLQRERGTLVNDDICREHLLENRFKGIRQAKLFVLLESIKRKWINYLNDIEKFFIFGGGAELLRDLDLNRFSDKIEIMENAEFLNAKGYTYIE